MTQGQTTVRVTAAQTGNRYALLECMLPSYCTGPQPHLHRRTTETIYILRGTLACTLEDETMIAGAGSVIVVQPGQAHRFWNPTGKPAVFLTLFSPPGAEVFAAVLLGQASDGEGQPSQPDWTAGQAADHDHYWILT